MTTDQLIQTLAEREITLFVENDSLRYRAPAGALSSEIRIAISDHRTTLIEQLRPKPRNNNQAEDPKCTYCDPKGWIDEPPKEGRIRTTCGKCGRYIGHRPANL